MKPMENVSVDQDRLGALYSQLGPVGAEDVVCRALEELGMRLSQCSTLFHENDRAGLRKNTRSLIAIADQIGMHALSRVAADVTNCIDHGNTVSVAATLSRLIRIGERSLTAVWDIQDITI
ncbi:hypothetical protein [Sulfitobacter noctilucae]|uniref:hypothetical protein n=1 Tax=Sulfitobacter noctilucae TaxID=1342302 RepID=UPI00046AEF9F|nr:hypothetical protein [Sulfitobacter noctilucae]